MSDKKSNQHQIDRDIVRLVSSNVPLVGWPAFPDNKNALTLALLHQLEQTEWWPPERLRSFQFSQLRMLLNFSRDNSPYYRELLNEVDLSDVQNLADNIWQNIPITRRSDLQAHSKKMRCRKLPRAHKPTRICSTSGSTGTPVNYISTQVTGTFYDAMNLRMHFWHHRDLSASVVIIRAGRPSVKAEVKPRSWAACYRTGPLYELDIQTPVHDQLRWILDRKPNRLVTYPANLRQLAEASIQTGIRFPTLEGVSTLGGVVDETVRDAAQRAWGLSVIDCYSCREAGFLAIQCPNHENVYHIQSESVLVEIVDELGRPCKVGETGHVTITVLHNYAQPLIRYDLGDYAEHGQLCSCGRGLPTLKRILGRSRNLLILEGGQKILPDFQIRVWPSIAPIGQVQILQTGINHLEVKAVVHRKVSDIEEFRLVEFIRESLGFPFEITFTYLDQIPNLSSGKFEDFICQVEKQ